jgi:ABC-type sugar transport system ATPase subunit
MATQDDPLVELDGVRKEFGDVTAVEGIDFAVRRGSSSRWSAPRAAGRRRRCG